MMASDRGGDLLGIAHVAGEKTGRAAARARQGSGLRAAAHDDLRAGFQQTPADASSNALAAPGDDSHLAAEVKRIPDAFPSTDCVRLVS